MGVAAILFTMFLAGISGPPANSTIPAVTPVQAELLMDLEARHLKVGEAIYAKVFIPWEGPGCTLARGAILEGKVLSAVPHSNVSMGSEVAVAFDRAQCSQGQMTSFPLVLAAVAVPEESDDSQTMDMPRALGSSASTSGPPSGFRSQGSYNSDVWWYMMNGFSRFPNVHAGGVYGIRGLSLMVATSPGQGSVLTAKDRDVALYKQTELLFIPEVSLGAKSPESPAPVEGPGVIHTHAADMTPPAAVKPEPLLEDETCAPPSCTVALAGGDSETDSHASASISIRSLGYAQRMEQAIDSFDQDETLSYLSPTELLVTFNPHRLVPRLGDTDNGGTVRIIRAALVDRSTRRVKRMVDWYLPDTRQYLWPLADHRVLVHVGNELRIYGAGLTEEQHLVLDGPLAFLRTDPAGETIAAGIVQERHSRELHASLRDNLGHEPDENVRVLVLNRQFQTTATSVSSTEILPPVLLNEGEVKLYRQSEKQFHLVILTWTGERRSLAHFTSTCVPQISTSAPDVLFLTTCSSLTAMREFRILRADGTTLLEGQSPPEELGDAVLGDTHMMQLVLKTVEADEPLDRGGIFHLSDLTSERLRVYSATSGRTLFSVHVNAPLASVDGFALAPNGRELAVLTRDQILVYALPRGPETP